MRTVTLKDVVLGQGSVKVIVPLTGRTLEELLTQARDLAGRELDIVEWRIDFFDEALDAGAVLDAAGRIVAELGGKPLLATFRTAGEGGATPIAADQYVAINRVLVESGLVDAIDVELFYERAAGDAIVHAARHAGVAVVMSNHDFQATPAKDELIARLRAMQNRGADIPKIAVMPTSPADVITLLDATQTMTSRYADRPVLTMSMGGLGVVTRLAGEVFGSCATFAMVGQASAPGQVPVEDLQPILRLLHANRRAHDPS